MKLKDNVLDILGNCRVEGNVLYLPDYQLDRADYVAVNKVLESLGGKWNRKEKGHIFDYCPQDALDNVILTGEYTDIKKELQFFPTPRAVAERICDWAEIPDADSVLEPSVGKGDLADVAWEYGPEYLFGLDVNVDMNKYLAEKPYDTQTGVDFLEMEFDDSYDRIVMNPPFSRQQDIDHIYKAFEVLSVGGIMVSVVSKSPFYRTNEKSLKFRAFLEEHNAIVEDLPDGAFKESGTMVRACLIKIVKTA
jgi:predicted RNA methylase